ncbi:Purinergic receptor P2Y [Mactra antiquata]
MDLDTFTNLSTTTTTSFENTTTAMVTRGAARKPPPIGYYGETRETLWKVFPPIIMAWGTIGNILTILVILRQMKTVTSTSVYLMALAVFDTMVLYTGPLRHWIKMMYEEDIRDQTDAGCRFQVYITYASLHMSSWLLVAVSVERAISVVVPHKVRLACTKYKAFMIVSVIFVVIFGANANLLAIYGLQGVNNQKCSVTSKAYLDFRDNVWQWIDLCMAFAVPFVILLICNTIIIVCLRRSYAKKRSLAPGQRSSNNESNSNKSTRSVSILMIALCAIFFLTMTPASVYAVYYPYKFKEIQKLFRTDPIKAWYDYQYLMFQHAVVTIVSYMNASFNFLLYVFSGTKFRHELCAMFRCRKPGQRGMMGSAARTTRTNLTMSKSSTVRTDSRFSSSIVGAGTEKSFTEISQSSSEHLTNK